MNGLAPIRVMEALCSARSRDASDVHFVVGMPVMVRVDGQLRAEGTHELTSNDLKEAISCYFTESEISRLRSHGDVTVTTNDPRAGAFRCHAYRADGDEALAVRMLAARIPSLDVLGLPAVVRGFANHTQGLVIFTGPTGSGKSTAMAALMNTCARAKAQHIITIEDPIEYRPRSGSSIISQREIGRDVSGFREGLIGALRSDPDVILIGEMRDRATMAAALTAAETGHLVLATLHTGSAPEAVDRIVGSFSGDTQYQIRMQLAQSLIAVVCLRLVPRASGVGRRAAAEVLIATGAVRSLIRESKTHQLKNVIATGRSVGMQTLESHLSELVEEGEVTEKAARQQSCLTAEPQSPGR